MTEGNIVVIDDRAENLNLLDEILSRGGYEVRLFPRGDIALRSVQTDQPDLILLDIMMPEMDGYEVCRKLKELPETKDIPVVFISAKSMTIDKVKAFQIGGVDYVTKPFHVDEVLARVKTHISLRRYQQKSENKNSELKNALSKLRLTQSQLIQSEKMASIGVLAAGIAHELNNPINFISISTKGLRKKSSPLTQLLRQFNKEDITQSRFEEISREMVDLDLTARLQAIEELITNIETGSERAVEIVNGLRSFSRLDKSSKELTDIHKALESALIILQNQIRGQITINREYSDIPEILGFPGKLTQVFMNILKNAIDSINSQDAAGGSKIITIQTAVDEGSKNQIRIHISDTGSGIPENVKSRLFDPFFTTKEVGSGTGLGLSIALGIVQSHNGKIEVSSEAGKGSIFTVHLPLEQKES